MSAPGRSLQVNYALHVQDLGDAQLLPPRGLLELVSAGIPKLNGGVRSTCAISNILPVTCLQLSASVFFS